MEKKPTQQNHIIVVMLNDGNFFTFILLMERKKVMKKFEELAYFFKDRAKACKGLKNEEINKILNRRKELYDTIKQIDYALMVSDDVSALTPETLLTLNPN